VMKSLLIKQPQTGPLLNGLLLNSSQQCTMEDY